MSLRDAVEEVVIGMVEETEVLNSIGDIDSSRLLLSYVRQLRIALKASDLPLAETLARPAAPMLDAATQHRSAIEAAKEEFRKKEGKSRDHADVEEDLLERAAEVADGPSAGVSVMLPGGMPCDAYTMVGGQRYQLRADNRLHHAPVTPPLLTPDSKIRRIIQP